MASQEEWIFEWQVLVQFLMSPRWSSPVYSFMETNCIVFDTEEENKFVYTDIFNSYKEFVEQLLDEFITELSITPEQLAAALSHGQGAKARSKKRKKGKALQKPQFDQAVFKSVTAAEDFLVFKSMMVRCNIDLEMQVRRMYEAALTGDKPAADDQEQPRSSAVLAQAQLDPSLSEDEVLQEAIKRSLEDVVGPGAGGDASESQLARALEMSRKEQERLAVEAQNEQDMLEKVLALSLEDTTPTTPAPAKATPVPKPKAMPKADLASVRGLPDIKLPTPAPAAAATGASAAAKPPSLPPTADKPMALPKHSLITKEDTDAAAQRWMLDAQAHGAAGAAGSETDSGDAARASFEERKRYLLEQRDRIVRARLEEREVRLRRFKAQEGSGDAAHKPHPPLTPLTPTPAETDRRASLRRLLAGRLKTEVIDQQKK